MRFITEHAERVSADGLRWGVEPICRVLTEHGVAIAPSTYYASLTRPASARAVRDELVLAEIVAIQADRQRGNGCYGARKMYRQLRRQGGVDGRPCRAARSSGS